MLNPTEGEGNGHRVLYSVRGWENHFENSQSRKVTKASWIPVPNKHDGKSFRRVMAMANGPALYGAWIMILQVASKCQTRGELADEDGPLTAEDLAFKTGGSESLFSEALTVFSGDSIRWLEAEELGARSQTTPSTLPARSHRATSTLPEPATVSSQNRTEGNGTEGDRTEGTERKEGTASAASRSKRFLKPSVAEVSAYISESGYTIDPTAFVDFYDSVGWKIGKGKPMKDWKAAVRTWERREKQPPKGQRNVTRAEARPGQFQYDNDDDVIEIDDDDLIEAGEEP